MALAWKAGDIITGLSSDTKPTTNLPTGYIFRETDTKREYYWNGSTWTGMIVDEAALNVANIGGTLDVVKGGTGNITLTGWLKGSGTSALTTVVNPIFGVFTGCQSGTSNTNRFYPINGGNTSVSTEADVAVTFNYAFTLKRIQYIVSGNTKDANTVVSFRDDGVDIQSATITAASNTDFDSGTITTVVAANSKINFRVDASASTTGTIVVYMYAYWEASVI